MLLQIEKTSVEPDITLLKLAGRISLGRESTRLEELIKQLQGEGVSKLVLEMSEVSYIDSAGLGILTFGYGTMKSGGGEMRIASPHPRVQGLLKFTQIDRLIPVFASVEDACRNFDAGQTAAG